MLVPGRARSKCLHVLCCAPRRDAAGATCLYWERSVYSSSLSCPTLVSWLSAHILDALLIDNFDRRLFHA